ncbi:hypothetical protein ADIS_4242 [Lunatimonas lonarensis]|uniref:Uncharacterized protein n=1 Tax=Lunatimonas lonarensis TaxID=1232681 RepID=R7ZMT6_9BACT|nr:hypothetical protein ADIS_4242 [Lunatimonas lonarensis]
MRGNKLVYLRLTIINILAVGITAASYMGQVVILEKTTAL